MARRVVLLNAGKHDPETVIEPILQVERLTKRFGGLVALSNVSFDVDGPTVVGVIGPNGAGKSTLLKVLSGVHRPDEGTVTLAGRRIDRLAPHRIARGGVALASQVPRPFRRLTIRQNIEIGTHVGASRRSRRALVESILARTGLRELADRPAATVGLLDLKRLELARALSLRPSVLLLDEVAAGLAGDDLKRIVELVGEIADSRLSIILVEHVEALVHALARRVLVLDWGQVVADGTPESVARDENVRAIYLGDGQAATSKPVPKISARLPGADVLALDGVSAAYGSLRALRDVDLRIGEGEMVAVLGANGAGKSTLAALITGAHAPTSGRVRFRGAEITGLSPHRRVALGIGSCPEGRHVFGELTVAQNLALGAYSKRSRERSQARLREVHELFPILAERAGQRAGTLSGGQQQMLAIARGLMGNPVLLVIDEVSLGLSPKAADEIYAALVEINHRGTSVVVIEQNVHRALAVTRRAYVIERGQVSYAGPSQQLLDGGRLDLAYFGRAAGAEADGAGAGVTADFGG